LRPFQSGFSHSFSPMWKLRTRPCARNTSCHRQPQPSCSHGHPHPIIPRRLLPPLRKMRSLIHPSKDQGRRVVGLALVPTWSVSLVVSASDDDDPIRQTAAARSQVRSEDIFRQGGTGKLTLMLCSTRSATRRKHAVATSLVNRLRRERLCEKAAEVGRCGRCVIAF
jgi:hypothetical protein